MGTRLLAQRARKANVPDPRSAFEVDWAADDMDARATQRRFDMPALRSLRGRRVEPDRSCVDPALALRARLTDLAPRSRLHVVA